MIQHHTFSHFDNVVVGAVEGMAAGVVVDERGVGVVADNGGDVCRIRRCRDPAATWVRPVAAEEERGAVAAARMASRTRWFPDARDWGKKRRQLVSFCIHFFFYFLFHTQTHTHTHTRTHTQTQTR